MSYKCPECNFTGEGWHRWNCSLGRAKFSVNPTFTPVLDHFNKVAEDHGGYKREMLPVIKDE